MPRGDSRDREGLVRLFNSKFLNLTHVGHLRRIEPFMFDVYLEPKAIALK